MDLVPSRIARPLAASFALCSALGALHLSTVAHAQEVPAPAAEVQAAPPPPAAVLPPPAFQAPRPVERQIPIGAKGEVISVGELTATISVGARHGITPGLHVLFVARALKPNDPFDADTVHQVVGEVVNVSEDAALVSIGMMESVAVGQQVEITARRLSTHRMAPPRPPATLILEGGLRPFLPIKRVSIGAFADLALTYLPKIPMFVRAELLPVGGRVGAGADMGALGGMVSVGYDQRYVAIGLGAGVVYHRDFIDNETQNDTHLGAAVPRFQFAQLLRAGARDGLHLQVKTAFALASERWRLATLTVAGQVPVATRVALSPRIQVAPNAGVFLAEIGVRLLVRGNGGNGSLFLRPVGGVSGTFDGDNNGFDYYDGKIAGAVDKMLFGPMLGLDLEFRI